MVDLLPARLESVAGRMICVLSLRFHLSVCWISRENEVEEVKNEGPKEMTLDEWKAMQDKERTKVEFNIRKPNEGTDSQWKKGYVLHKSKSEDVSLEMLVLLAGVGIRSVCEAAETSLMFVMLRLSFFVSFSLDCCPSGCSGCLFCSLPVQFCDSYCKYWV